MVAWESEESFELELPIELSRSGISMGLTGISSVSWSPPGITVSVSYSISDVSWYLS